MSDDLRQLYSKFDGRHGPVRLRGVAWQRMTPEPGAPVDAAPVWIRHMLRVHRDSTSYWSETFHVPAPPRNHPDAFCVRCLGGDVSFLGLRGTPGAADALIEEWVCHRCTPGRFQVVRYPQTPPRQEPPSSEG